MRFGSALTACLFASILCAGCTSAPPPPAEKIVPVSNAGFKVEQLFTDQTGTSIFRFWDQGDWRYYAVNPKAAVQMLPTTHYIENTEIETVTDTDNSDHHDHGHDGGGHGGGGHDGGHGGNNGGGSGGHK